MRVLHRLTARDVGVVMTAISLAVACGGRDELRAHEWAEVDHQVELAIGENDFVARFVIPVDGYSYVDEHDDAYEDLTAMLGSIEEGSDADIFGAVSLHSVVADDPAQNTARSRTGDEVGYLVLVELSEAAPFGADEEWSQVGMLMSVGGREYDPVVQLDLSGTAVFVFENSELPESRYHYVWLEEGVGAIIDGSDREPIERWLAAYLTRTKLADGETLELSERLVTVPGFRYWNVNAEGVAEFEQLLAQGIAYSQHLVANDIGSIGMLALVGDADAAELDQWAKQLANYEETGSIAVRGHRVAVLDGGFEGTPVRAYSWSDGTYSGLFTTRPRYEAEVLSFIDGFLSG